MSEEFAIWTHELGKTHDPRTSHLLHKSGLKAQPEKTKFFLRKVQFLGHVVDKDGIQPVKKG